MRRRHTFTSAVLAFVVSPFLGGKKGRLDSPGRRDQGGSDGPYCGKCKRVKLQKNTNGSYWCRKCGEVQKPPPKTK